MTQTSDKSRLLPDAVIVDPFTGGGGPLPTKIISAASTNAALIKAGPARVYAITMQNLVATQRFVKLYNKSTAPAPATDTPVMTFAVPTGGAVIGLHCDAIGILFPLGLGIAIVANVGDNDNTAVAAGDILVNLVSA